MNTIKFREFLEAMTNLAMRVTGSRGHYLHRISEKPAYISFTFDDCPQSALTEGRIILEQAGVRGTFYLAGRFCENNSDDEPSFRTDSLSEIAASGHEIGCHTYDHLPLDLHSYQNIENQLKKNQSWLADNLPGYTLRSFAYPMGRISSAAKRAAAKYYVCARGIDDGINRGTVDLFDLRANKVYSRLDNEASLINLISELTEQGGWLIFYTHDVQDQPSPFGCEPRFFARIVEAAAKSSIEILPVGEVMDRIGFGR